MICLAQCWTNVFLCVIFLCLYGFIDLFCLQLLSSCRSVEISKDSLSGVEKSWRNAHKSADSAKMRQVFGGFRSGFVQVFNFQTPQLLSLALDLQLCSFASVRQETFSRIFALNRSAISVNFSKQCHPYQVTNSHRSLVLDSDHVSTMSLRRPRNWSWMPCGDCLEVHAIRRISSPPDVLCAECWTSHSNWSWNSWNVLEGQCLSKVHRLTCKHLLNLWKRVPHQGWAL